MPSVGFFRQAGLFVVPNFLEREVIVETRREMEIAPDEKALIIKPGGEERLDEGVRRLHVATPPERIRALLKQRLVGLTPEVERHFNLKLAGFESPHYLIYQRGDFFKPHIDGDYSAGNAQTRKRRVSVVIFLNRETAEPTDGAYGEGRLTFHGLLGGAQWERCAFDLESEPGLLIAFPSNKVHEVTPVSHGKRFTVVTWFYAPDAEESETGATVPEAQTQAVQEA